MIIGVGIDVVDVARFGRSLDRTPRLAIRVFTPAERALSVASMAARFAAKEALAKALGAPAGLAWHDCEVVTDATGRPWLEIRDSVAVAASGLGVVHLHVSLSHDAGIASAVVVLEG